MTPPEGWTLSNTIAGQFSNLDPVLTSDEQYLFVGLESAIHVYSVTTSRLYRTLQLKSGQHIVGYALSPANQEDLFIFTSTGSVTRWDWLSGEQTSCLDSRGKTISIDLSIHETDDHTGFRLTSLREHKDGKKEIVITTLSDGNPRETLVLQTAARISQIKVVRNGQVIVAYGSQNVLLGVACTETTNSVPSYSWREVKLPVNITCLDLRCTPRAEESTVGGKSRAGEVDLVLGDIYGSILLYHDIIGSFEEDNSEMSRKPAPRRLHWHRGPVSAVRWSRDGNYIISGGHESVMVLWQLETGRKHFLPHLSSPICNIIVSSTGNTYVVKLADNCIMLLSARELQPFATIIGLQLYPKATRPQDRSVPLSTYCAPQSTTAALHPQHPDRILLAVPASRQLTQCGRPLPNSSVLQTYDINTNSHLSRQALARTNATTLSVSPEGSQIVAPDVVHLSISHDGKWMATVDDWCPYPQDVEALELLGQKEATCITVRETYLKFWKWNTVSGTWELATRVDGPHFSRDGPLPVLELASRPRSHEFATIGLDMVSVDPSDAGLAILIDAQSCEVHYSRTGLYTEQSLSIWNIVDDTVRVVPLAGGNSPATASPLLAVSPMTETFAVATPDVQENQPAKKTRQPQFRVRVYDIHSLSLVYQSPLRYCPLALLADPSSVDYIIVDSAANIQRLGSTKKISHPSQSSPDTAIHLHSGLASLFGSKLRGTGITPLPHGSDSLPRSDPSTAQSKSLASVFGDVPPFVLPPANKLFHDVVHALSG
ncbi:WD repeat protein [Aspergillus affinis]|uniref:WD repeat protein n=1 Tax=Aspergillus affinis TaxID=1070780 RepID=UPI0022FF3D2D|nr:WD domain protein [Aspergillus affinis]KAI9039256.1 WD domain protein [Aspergillus affinis]